MLRKVDEGGCKANEACTVIGYTGWDCGNKIPGCVLSDR